MEDHEDVGLNEEFDMSMVDVPDLGLDDHAVSEDYHDEVSQAKY